jgi:hypothetical protein
MPEERRANAASLIDPDDPESIAKEAGRAAG